MSGNAPAAGRVNKVITSATRVTADFHSAPQSRRSAGDERSGVSYTNPENEGDDVTAPINGDVQAGASYSEPKLARESHAGHSDGAQGQKNDEVTPPSRFAYGFEAGVKDLGNRDLRRAEVQINVGTHILFRFSLDSQIGH